MFLCEVVGTALDEKLLETMGAKVTATAATVPLGELIVLGDFSEVCLLVPNKKQCKRSACVLPLKRKNGWLTTDGLVRGCVQCGTEKTPMWRSGPSGAKTLCNACGVRWKKGRISY
jgi:hypothetical protein